MPPKATSGIPVAEQAIDLPARRVAGFLRPSVPKDQRFIAIGDVHGRWDLLAALIRTIDVKMTQLQRLPTKLIILGDFIDRGPDSQKIIELLMRASRKYQSFIVLKGNHEDSLIAATQGDADAQRLWLEHGGTATLQSFGIAPKGPEEDRFHFAERIRAAIGLETMEWLMDLRVFLNEPPFFFCHAGVRPGRPLLRQDDQDMLWIRKAFMESTRDHGAVVVHGHNIVEDVEVRKNRISLDTGAYFSGMLSAIMLDPFQSIIFRAGPTPEEASAKARPAD